MTRYINFFGLFVLIGMVAACATYNDQLAQDTYRATDRVISQVGKINPNTPLLVTTLSNIDNLETSATFGRIVAEQVSTRLAQRGYNVIELKMRNGLNIKQGLGNSAESGEHILTRDVNALKGEHKAAAVITGTYAIAGRSVLVNLKFLDVKSGRIMGSTDYTVPFDNNLQKLLRTSSNNGAIEFFGNSIAYQ